MILHTSMIKFFIIIGGIFFIGFGAFDLYCHTRTPIDYNNLTEADIKGVTIVEGDLPINYGCFQESYMTENGSKSGSSQYMYLIPISSEKFMALQTNKKDLVNSLETQYKAAISSENAEDAQTLSPVHFKGIVKSLKGTNLENAKKYLLSSGLDEATIDDYIVPYYINCKDFSQWPLMVGLGGLCIIWDVIWIIKDKKKKQMTY